ncbi:hypothetical protein RF11_09598 [Thelohanellus kitauei]|uniref:Uncharacterized protein n=1 Tax=Thelohanellus kitauei TaxID=669202 RepID=A0A0C2M5E4_THEKT|nr:hypothetical protein RF11_09598 [Thelohanellus kitauei]
MFDPMGVNLTLNNLKSDFPNVLNLSSKTKIHDCSCVRLEVFIPAPVHFCTDFTSTANATVSTYGRDVLREDTLLQAVRVVQDIHLLNTHYNPQPTRATIPKWPSFTGKLNQVIN